MLDEDEIVQRDEQLGFRPQKENVYNNLLPYADKLDEESSRLFFDIKSNLIKSVLAREMRPGCALWTSRLNKYMKIYGLKFSKEDHIALIKLYYELLTIPDLEPTRINKYSSTLQFLLKKKYLLSQEDLCLDWRPLYKLCCRVIEKSTNDIGLYRTFSGLIHNLEMLIKCARIYFPASATQEILDEFRHRLCPYNADITIAIEYLEIFLPIVITPAEADIGYNLWLEEFMKFWEVCNNASAWENSMTWLMARLSSYTVGHINWEPYIPLMFVRFLRTMQLPVGYRQKQSGKLHKIDTSAMTLWIVCTLGGECETAFFHLEKFMQTLESYYHPANIGKWTPKIREVLRKLSYYLVQRVHCERHRKSSWDIQIPDSFKLTDAQIDRFINILKPSVEQAVFSRQGFQDVTQALQYLSSLRPNIIIPIVLDKMYQSMDSITEPHKLTSSMMCVVAVGRYMVQGAKYNYPEGPTHVIPLLMALLPGIDPNDIRKCFTTFNFISHFVSMCPLINSSEASKYHDLSEEEHIICEASAGFEDFVLQFFDRICGWVESNSLDFVRLEQNDISAKSKIESMAESALMAVITSVLCQCSPEIFTSALRKVHDFATNRILELKVSGKLVALLCSCFAKRNPKEMMKLFVPHLCDTIERLLAEHEDITKEENLGDELLYNMLLLSEITDGNSELLNYIDRIDPILEKTLHMNARQGYVMAAQMLSVILSSLTLLHPIEYRSLNKPYTVPIKDFLTVRHWGQPGKLKNLEINWYVPGDKEIACAQKLLHKYLVPELEKLSKYSKGEMVFTREELRRSLMTVIANLAAQTVLPLWHEPALQLVESLIEPWEFEIHTGCPYVVTMPDGSNIRKSVIDVIRNVQKKILKIDEGDTKSICHIINIYDILLFNKYRGRDFEMHWKSFHAVKKILEDRLHQKKLHLRHTLIDRVMLQQEFRNESRSCNFTETHRLILTDLYQLCTSHYSEVRSTAQHKLFSAVGTFPYSYTVLIPQLKQTLQLDSAIHHEEFKGCLYVLLGPKNTPIISRHDWSFVSEMWPRLIKSTPSEKPSIVNLMNALADAINRSFPTITLAKIDVSEKCLVAAQNLAKNYPKIKIETFEELINKSTEYLVVKRAKNLEDYNKTISLILDSVINGNLHWRYHSMALGLIRDLVHPDVNYSSEVVKFFLRALINESIGIRKIALRVVSFCLYQNKPKFKKIVIDPYSFSDSKDKKLAPGIRSDNRWLLYNKDTVPRNAVDWDAPRYVHEQSVGYYSWPKELKVYAPTHEQPSIYNRMDKLTDEEKEIFAFFNEDSNIEVLIKYFSMEEKKGKDQFNGYRFLVFKNLFKIFEDMFLDVFIAHLQRLVRDKQEQSQRCAAELIGSIISGSKHWSFEKVTKMWSKVIPVIHTAFANISAETMNDWGICIMMGLDSRDPNRHHWLLEALMNNPLAESTSFIACGRLHLLQCALNQQSWRNCELIFRLLEYFKNHLSHPFQNVREKISSSLTTIFCKDISFFEGNVTHTPKISDFFAQVMPKLNVLYDHIVKTLKDLRNDASEPMQVGDGHNLSSLSLSNDSEKEEAIRLFKTVSKYVTGSITRVNYAAVPEFYQLVPLACILQNDDTDDELDTICSNLLAVLAHTLILDKYMQTAINAIQNATHCPFWSARAVIAEFIPVLVFHNMAIIIARKEWVLQIQNIVLDLLEDLQPEVRIKASQVLSGLLHCGFIPSPSDLLVTFKQKAKTKLSRRNLHTNSQSNSNVNNGAIRVRHAGVLGLCTFISSHPYDVPDYLPSVFDELGVHLNDPQPIPAAIRKTLGDFKRTHHDNWEVHKLKFTEEELSVLSDLTVPPSYYA